MKTLHACCLLLLLAACQPSRAPEPQDPRLQRLPYPERVDPVPIEKPKELTEIEKLLERRRQQQYNRSY